MVLIGTLVNGLCIVLGTVIGLMFHAIPERIKESILKIIGLFVMLLGIQSAIGVESYLILLISLTVGIGIGEAVDIDNWFHKLGDWVGKRLSGQNSNVAVAFVAATLLFGVGAMSILGSLDAGLRHDNTILFTKSFLDGVTSIILASTLGIGVMLSAIPVMLFEGVVTLLAVQINSLVPKELMSEIIMIINATGGVLLMALGLNMVGAAKIKVANILPSIVIGVMLVIGLNYF